MASGLAAHAKPTAPYPELDMHRVVIPEPGGYPR